MEVDYSRFIEPPKYPVKFAFEVAGIPYFEFESMNNMPILRFTAYEDIKETIQNGVDRTYMEAFLKAGIQCINEGQLNKLGVLFENLEERMSHITNIDMLYAISAIFYFDYNENPNKPDDQHNAEKIELWKKENIDDFFLKTRFYPSHLLLNTTIATLRDYMLYQRKTVKVSTNHLLSILSAMKDNGDLTSRLQSQMETLDNLIKSEP